MEIRVFRPVVTEGLEWVQPVDEADFDAVYDLDGTSKGEQWSPIRVRRLAADERGRRLRRADLPWLGGHALVFRDPAREAVGHVLADAGEFLELDLVDEEDRLWLFNVCTVTDALDEEASDLARFPSSGRIMTINRHTFRREDVTELTAFRVPQVRSLFLSGGAVEQISGAQLMGANFELVWEADASR